MPQPSYYDDMGHHVIRLHGASCGQIFVAVCEHNYLHGSILILAL